MNQDFIDAMAEEFFEGSRKGTRVLNDWKAFDWDHKYEILYTAKLVGHMAKALKADDPIEKCKHLAKVACNANILWHHTKKET